MWPRFDESDPRAHEQVKALEQVSEFDPETGVRRARRLAYVYCDRSSIPEHAPTLGEIWDTAFGLYYFATLPGATGDPDDDPSDPTAPPTAVLGAKLKEQRLLAVPATFSPKARQGALPFTVVAVNLAGAWTAVVWGKCREHGPAAIDVNKLVTVADEFHRLRRKRDDDTPFRLRLTDVRWT